MATADRDYMKNRIAGYDDLPDMTWADEPAPSWPEMIRLTKHRLEHLLRTADFDNTGQFFGLVEVLLKLHHMESNLADDQTPS